MGKTVRRHIFCRFLLGFDNVSLSASPQLKIGSGTAIVLSSATAVKELMDKRSGNTVDRPANHMSFTVQRGYNMVMAGYSASFS